MRAICVYRQYCGVDRVRVNRIFDEAKMELTAIPFGITDWSTIEPVAHAGQTGTAYWRTLQVGSMRVRMVEYSPGYSADHWCWRGHILLCLEGQLHTELEDGRQYTLDAGMSYQVGNDAEGHRSFTRTGAKLFIVD